MRYWAPLLLLVCACPDDNLTCGPGTIRQDDVCTPITEDAGPHDAGTPDVGTPRDAAVIDAERVDASVRDAEPAADVQIADAMANADATVIADAQPTPDAGPRDPGPPPFGPNIDTLTVSLRTGYGTFDGTDQNRISLCLTETDCWRLNLADVDDFRRGEIDVYHFENINLPRTRVDRVEFRTTEGTDLWRPHCLQLNFDGEPVHCENQLGIRIGTDPGDLSEWRDPNGLHRRCNSCFEQTLTHGPMVGAVTSSSAKILFRTDATRQSALRMLDRASGRSDIVQFLYPRVSRDYTAVAEVSGLQPNTEYTYLFEVEGELQPGVFTFKTAPAPGASAQTKIAFGSCSRNDDQPIFNHIRFYDPDLFFFIGDNHYGNTADRDSLRWHYQWGLSRAGRSHLAADTITLATWDDHDFTGNNTDGTSAGKDTALQVFSEYWANPSFGTTATPGTYFRYAYGDIEMFFLDDRYYRGFDNSILGAGQTTWLQDALSDSTATFKLILCGSQWTAAGSNDSWAAFLPARDSIFEHIRREQITGVVLLSGDVHRSELRTISRPNYYNLPEIVSSPLANTNSPCRPSGEVHTCVDSDNYFATIDINTTIADPSLIATIIDSAGRSQGQLTVRASELR